METTLDYEIKIICDGICHKCKHQREKDIAHKQDIIYYCRNCQEKYLCNEVLGQDKGSYFCAKCNSPITEMTVERAHQLGLAFGIKITHVIKSEKSLLIEIPKTWFYPLTRDIYFKELVTDLIDYEKLEIPHILDLMYHSDIVYHPDQTNLEKKRLLWDIFSKKPNVIKSIHNSLITRSEHRKVDLIIRALINRQIFNCSYLSSVIPQSILGTVDIIGIDETTAGIVWIIIQEDKIDEQIINSMLNEILSIPHLEFMGVERILLLTRKWIWMGAEIARRQGKINTRWKSIQIELWEEDSLFNYRKI